VVSLGGVASGQWVAVHGCGGVGLSAVQIAVAAGARVVAVDRSGAALTLARDLGAEVVLRLPDTKDVAQAIRDITHGGAHLSVEAVGHPEVCRTSVECLRRRGTHVQLGLLLGDQRHPSLPMDRLVAHELRIVGGHGMAARDYPELLNLMLRGRLDPQRIIQRWVNLDQGAVALAQMDQPGAAGITLIDTFASADP
jgi:alcohol dehydrogenase